MRSICAALAGVATLVAAQVQTQCQDSVCYSVHVPSSAASSGDGDIYFQIKAPSSYSWAGFGQGDGMAGANIFVIYADSKQTNVTLSPRYATGHVQPQHDTQAQLQLLAGSGISNGQMIANVKCSNCNSWNGGTMSFKDSQSSWIWAYKQGDPVASDSLSANIVQHDDMGNFNFDLTKAAGGADATNPFVSGGSNSSSTAGSSSSSSSSSGSSSDDDDSGGDGMMYDNVRTAHAALMSIAMVLLFPIGAMLHAFGASVWLHAGWQMFTLALAVAGMGCGIWIALDSQMLNMPHPIIGLVVVSTMSLQPISGMLQRMHARKHGSRSGFGWAHRVLGAALILLGMINGGLGLQLSGNSTEGEIAYGVLAGVMGTLWLAVSVWGTFRSSKRTQQAATKGHQ